MKLSSKLKEIPLQVENNVTELSNYFNRSHSVLYKKSVEYMQMCDK